MVKIKISYTERQELQKVLEVLKPYTLKIRQSKNQEGAFKKAYLVLNI